MLRPGLGWLGRHGSAVIAVGIFAGLVVPPLASLARPLLVPAVVLPFLIALIRMDWQSLRQHLRRPNRTIWMAVWLLALAPVLVHGVLSPWGVPAEIHGGLVLMAAAPPLMASGSIALLLGLDVALAVLLTVVTTALVPITLPLVGLYLLGVDLDVGGGELMLRLGIVVGGSFAVAGIVRRWLPPGFTERHREPLDGLAVVGLLVFALAIMDGVTAMLWERPELVLGATLAVYALNVALQAVGAALFVSQGRMVALTVGLCSGNTNLGLLLAAVADRAAVELVVFVAVAQLPIYTLPSIQRRPYRRWLARPTRPAR